MVAKVQIDAGANRRLAVLGVPPRLKRGWVVGCRSVNSLALAMSFNPLRL